MRDSSTLEICIILISIRNCTPVNPFNRYSGAETVLAVHRERPRDESGRIGHGVDFLRRKSWQSALLAAAGARAYPLEERQAWRSQPARSSWPEDRQHPRDLYEQRCLAKSFHQSDRFTRIDGGVVQRSLRLLVVVIVDKKKRSNFWGKSLADGLIIHDDSVTFLPFENRGTFSFWDQQWRERAEDDNIVEGVWKMISIGSSLTILPSTLRDYSKILPFISTIIQ